MNTIEWVECSLCKAALRKLDDKETLCMHCEHDRCGNMDDWNQETAKRQITLGGAGYVLIGADPLLRGPVEPEPPWWMFWRILDPQMALNAALVATVIHLVARGL